MPTTELQKVVDVAVKKLPTTFNWGKILFLCFLYVRTLVPVCDVGYALWSMRKLFTGGGKRNLGPWRKISICAKIDPKREQDSSKLYETQIEGIYSSGYDTDMLPGSYPHRKYVVCMFGNITYARGYSGDQRWCYRCGTTTTKSEDRATQPMEAGG